MATNLPNILSKYFLKRYFLRYMHLLLHQLIVCLPFYVELNDLKRLPDQYIYILRKHKAQHSLLSKHQDAPMPVHSNG